MRSAVIKDIYRVPATAFNKIINIENGVSDTVSQVVPERIITHFIIKTGQYLYELGRCQHKVYNTVNISGIGTFNA